MTAKKNEQRQRDHYLSLGMAIGMILFMPLGVVLLIVTDTPGLLGVGPAAGIGVGLAIGEELYRRSQQKQKEP